MNYNKNSLSIKDVKDIIKFLHFDKYFEPIDENIGLYSKLNFNNNKSKIILTASFDNPLMGHWSMVFGDNKYFDASGNPPLKVFERFKTLLLTNQDYNKLYEYYKQFNNIDYNDFNFQRNKSSTTCGHHCIVRFYYYLNGLTNNNDYKNFIIKIKNKYKYKSYDDLITDLLNLIIKEN